MYPLSTFLSCIELFPRVVLDVLTLDLLGAWSTHPLPRKWMMWRTF